MSNCCIAVSLNRAKQITNYKAIRYPMQLGSGSFLLDNDLQAISDSVSIFLDHCDR
ncbi:MAG: hypothetical protein ACYTXA_09735 [Nostoc sp.]